MKNINFLVCSLSVVNRLAAQVIIQTPNGFYINDGLASYLQIDHYESGISSPMQSFIF